MVFDNEPVDGFADWSRIIAYGGGKYNAVECVIEMSLEDGKIARRQCDY